MNMRASDLSARLLATENLAVVRARAKTASFDIKSRVLTLPMWKEMTPEVEDMLIGHEVGHALYTGEEYIKPIQENRKLMGYMNIVEDVRIEKLIKRKYPGLRKRMNEGYKQLNERDFFGVKSIQNFDDLLLIDKINLYFKVGFQCGVKFTADEKVFVNRAERTETVDEVIQLAQDIYTYSKEQAEQKKQQRQANGEADEEDEDEQDPMFGDFDPDLDGEWDEEESDEQDLNPYNQRGSNKHDDSQSDEEDLEAKTDRAFQQKLEDLADDSTEYNYWKFDTDYYESPVVGYKKVLSETKTSQQWTDDPSYTGYDYNTRYMNDKERVEYWSKIESQYDQFKTDSLRTVNYLVKEFEMKKSAQMYKRAQVSKSGSLDMKKVYAYKLQDDLFKRVTTLPQGKNHGMIMLLDWSGSMDGVLEDTLKQVINLAMFCQRIQVPYRVYAFTSQYEEDIPVEERQNQYRRLAAWNEARRDREGNILSNARDFNLIELFSDKMTTTEFNTMSKRVLDYRFRWNKGYSTGGTPLNEALAWCYLNLGEFIKSSNIEKTTFITLTDGEGGALQAANRGNYLDEWRSEVIDGQYKRVKQRHFIRDEITQKTYEIRRDSTVQTDAILRMIKDRYNVTTVGFYICRNHRGDLRSVIRSNIPEYNGNTDLLIDEWRKSFRQDNFASVKNTGRDELFLIPQNATKIQEGDLDVKADAKATAIARNFSKYLNVKKTSRVLLNRFVALVA